jgi:hypothetical protein
LFGSIGITGFADVESPENTSDGDEKRLLGELLAWTDSPSPSEGGVSLTVRIGEIWLEISFRFESVRIRIILGIMINLLLALTK